MEPKRPKVDRAVLDFVKEHILDPADFVIRADGICRLNPEMARMVVRVSTLKGLRPSRSRHIADVADRDQGRLNWADSRPQTLPRKGRSPLRADVAQCASRTW
jgi:hypothetical protein